MAGRPKGTKNGKGKHGRGVLVVSKNGREYYHYAERKRPRFGSAEPGTEARAPVRSLADHPLRAGRDPSRAVRRRYEGTMNGSTPARQPHE